MQKNNKKKSPKCNFITNPNCFLLKLFSSLWIENSCIKQCIKVSFFFFYYLFYSILVKQNLIISPRTMIFFFMKNWISKSWKFLFFIWVKDFYKDRLSLCFIIGPANEKKLYKIVCALHQIKLSDQNSSFFNFKILIKEYKYTENIKIK